MTSNPVGPWAIVTGASSGLGDAFARQLAERGMNLVLVARRRDRLEALAEELRKGRGVQVEVFAVDLGQPGAAVRLHEAVAGRPVALLVNNAGYGLKGRFTEIDWARHEAMVRVDILALTELTWLFARDMVARGSGRILQVASIGAYQPTPWFSAYGAAKAYVLHFSEGLAYELAGTGVTVTTLSPGATATEFMEVAGTETKGLFAKMLMSPSAVAAIGLQAAFHGRRTVVAGWMNALNAWMARRIPRRLATWLSAKMLE